MSPSPAGEALATFPPRVPMWRRAGEPIVARASLRIGSWAVAGAERISAWVAAAPISTPPSVVRIPRSSGISPT